MHSLLFMFASCTFDFSRAVSGLCQDMLVFTVMPSKVKIKAVQIKSKILEMKGGKCAKTLPKNSAQIDGALYGDTMLVSILSGWAPGGVVLPYKRLMGMCRWMGSHFHDWIDYSGGAFSKELLEWGCTFFFGGGGG